MFKAVTRTAGLLRYFTASSSTALRLSPLIDSTMSHSLYIDETPEAVKNSKVSFGGTA